MSRVASASNAASAIDVNSNHRETATMSETTELGAALRRVWNSVFPSPDKQLPAALDTLLKNPAVKSLRDALQKYWPKGNMPSQLALFADLRDQSQLPAADIENVILDGRCTSIMQVIEKYYQTWRKTASMQQYASRLFEKQPALVMAHLINQKVLPLPDDICGTLSDLLESYPADFDFLHQSPDAMTKKVQEVLQTDVDHAPIVAALETFQRLGQIIVEPENLAALMAQGYKSIERVAYSATEPFYQQMTSFGMLREHAARIHSQAISLQVRLEQNWMTMLQGQQNFLATPELSSDNSDAESDSSADSDSEPSQKNAFKSESLSDWFGDLDEVACDECCSVTSPAAYLVDLLRLLEVTPCQFEIQKPKAGLKAIKDNEKDTLLKRLFERRPDIGDLLLSCRNTKEIVPYIDLANEVMESAVHHLERSSKMGNEVTKMTIKAFDADSVAQQHELDGAQNTQSAVYDEYISQRIFPAHVFPFDHSMATFENYLTPTGVSLAEVYQSFWPLIDESDELAAAYKNTLPRVHSACMLGLSDVDFVALTGESIWSSFLTRKNIPINSPVGNNRTTPIELAAYWGYEGEKAEATMLDDKNGTGLPFIKKQLLPRLGIKFEVLVDVLRSEFMDNTLVVALMPDFTEYDPSRNVPTQLNGFRLRSTRDSGELKTEDCHHLGQFVRLYQRLGWSVANVDDALGEFGKMVKGKLGITPQTIEQLAAMKETQKLASALDIRRIVALWAQDGEYMRGLTALTEGNEESTRALALFLATIGMDYQDYLHVKQQQGLDDSLDIESIFIYHRFVTTAKLFGVPVVDVESLMKLLNQDQQLWTTPVDMLSTLKAWQKHKLQGWDLSALKESFELDCNKTTVSSDFREKAHAFFAHALESYHQLNTTSQGSPVELIRATLARTMEEGLLALFPNTDSSTVKTLFNTKLDDADKDALTHILDRLLNAKYQSLPIQLSADGYLICSEACEVTICYSSGETQRMSIQKDSLTLVPNVSESTKISLSSDSNDSLEVGVIDLDDMKGIETQLYRIKLYASVCGHTKLAAPEIALLFGPDRLPWGGNALHRATAYDTMREGIRKASSRADIQQFLRVAQTATESERTGALSEALRLPESTIQAVLDGFTSWADIQTHSQGQPWIDEKFLYAFSTQLQLLTRLSLAEDAIDLLRDVIIPSACQDHDATDAPIPSTHLGGLLKASQLAKGRVDAVRHVEDELRVRRRQALMEYLLQHPYFQSRPDVQDADGLFEFFLIDVQMGAALDTSRIKQAISTIQLFVQRCLLGLEPTIDGRVIDRSRWAWMCKFNLWEASRKVFLYPENWADPTLRDNKTEPFQALETSLLQMSPDDTAISKLIRSYVYDMTDIANLRLESFFWDQSGTEGREGVFHFFARTRTSPAKFYYRQLKYLSQNCIPTTNWTAWQHIPLDIRVFDVDAEGNSLKKPGTYIVPACWGGRVFLFLPQIMTRAVPNNTDTSEVSFQLGGKDNAAKLNFGKPTSKVQMNIEIKMAWSEFVENAWTAPVQAHDFIKLEKKDSMTPDIGQFQFRADARDSEVLTVHVVRQIKEAPTEEKVGYDLTTTEYAGRFELRGTRLVVMTENPLKTTLTTDGNALLTSYGQLSTKLADTSVNLDGALKKFTQDAEANKDSWPLVLKPKLYSSQAVGNVTWTFDSALRANQQPLGLVADFPTKDKTGNESWFTLPQSLKRQGEEDFQDDLATPFFNPLSEQLREALSLDGDLEKLYEVMDKIQVIPEDKNESQYYTTYQHSFGRFRLLNFCNETSTPYSLYNWEIGFHIISLVVERLLALQQFDLAVTYGRLVFDPTLTRTERNRWRFPPFRDDKTREAGTMDAILDSLRPSTGEDSKKSPAILEWQRNAFSPHVVARSRPLAYMKRFVMKYLEALIASGDNYFRQDSLESIPLAIQRYVEASHILGPAPHKVPKVGEVKFQSYNALKRGLNDFSNASVPFNLSSPYFVPLQQRGLAPTKTAALQGFPMTKYFGVTPNPEFAALRTRVDDRLSKIRACLDINGKPRRLPLDEPRLDPGQLVKAAAETGSLSSVLSLFDGPLPRHRFQYLFQKALDLCADLKTMSATLLTTIEKRDAEALQNLRSRHDTDLQRFLVTMKVKQRAEVEKGIEHLQETRASAVSRMQYYLALTGDETDIKPPAPDEEFEELRFFIPRPSSSDPLRLSANEALEIEYADQSSYLNGLAINKDFWASLLFCIPMPSINGQPGGVGMSIQTPNFGQAFQYEASALRAEAGLAQESGQWASRMAQFTRQLLERRLQINLAGHEIKSIDKQIEAQRAHLDVIDHDILAQQKQADNALAVEEFLRSKFTSTELYAWLEATSRALLYQIYILAIELAKKAEKSFTFETGLASTFIHAAGYWDDKRNGFECGEQLWLALKKMELAHAETRPHNFEISKNISLRQLSADSLLRLRTKGDVTFSLPEELFDLDFPGHYMRRIKSLSVSFHCVAGPYTSISGTLSLESHTQRITDTAPSPYQRGETNDNRFTREDIKLPISAIAISSGQQDSGVFDLDFRSNDYQPFEGAGAISTWRLRLPDKFPQFDYSTISDVVLHLRYTAKEGSSELRTAATQSLTEYMNSAAELSQKFGLNTMLSVRSDYPQAWHAFSVTRGDTNSKTRTISLTGLKARLPFFTRAGKTVTLKDVTIYLSLDGTVPSMSFVSDLDSSKKDAKSLALETDTNDKLGTMHKFRVATIPNDPKSKSPKKPSFSISQIISSDQPLHVLLEYSDGTAMGKIHDMLVILEYTLA